MATLPQDPALDSAFSLLRHGYRFISGKCRTLHTDVFRTRLLLRPVVCMQGAEAARLFYEQDKFLRHGAMPARIQKTLTGVDGVQSLDGQPHRHRKHLFIRQLMSPARIEALATLHQAHWHAAMAQWPLNRRMVLFDEAQKILCQSVCAWAGIPLPASELNQRAQAFGRMIDSGARLGLAHWRGRRARKSAEQWISAEIKKTRATGPENSDSLLQAFAWHRDEQGHLLPAGVAAVELINVLRPTVAIAQFMTFSVLALHEYPYVRAPLESSHPDYLDWFVLEVRRFYPFFPFLAAYTRQAFTWQGFEFQKGMLTLLDIYGTNHDPRCWYQPDTFNPERFSNWPQDHYTLLANGGATYEHHHRCPGEWITHRLMKVMVRFLVDNLHYEIPAQDLSFSLADMPALPKSRMIIRPVAYQPVPRKEMHDA
ncbi:fatty-acid peroxygenase [Methylophilus rhizosphaerae]|uniref:Fatty-acid peroxygenase n=1 Tax=Methylophilus rhizosphaerae TaxID=492660 RepID=A0A1G9CSE0_9PROT|nr:cytochrome P450 [Methylophilus rhizosphaerae]SDK54631.1 fatty-acid peroxygenase [Methylophilus rhizosphaerae]